MEDKKLKAQVVSDLHLEFGGVYSEVESLIPINGNVLILPGDIGSPNAKNFVIFFEWASKNFEHVLYVPGNHEYYNTEYNSALKRIRKDLSPFENVHVLYRSSVKIGGIKFVGCTFWTRPPNKQRSDMVWYKYNDYRYIKYQKDEKKRIRELHIQDTTRIHDEDVVWLQGEFDKCRELGEECYVITHHVPLLGLKFLILRERKRRSQDVWYGNCTDESDLITKNSDVLKAWFYGHTHFSSISTFGKSDLSGGDIKVEKEEKEEEKERKDERRIWVISNQVGYTNGRKEAQYDKNLVLEFPLGEAKKEESQKWEGEESMEIWGEIDVEEEIKEEKEKEKKKGKGIFALFSGIFSKNKN